MSHQQAGGKITHLRLTHQTQVCIGFLTLSTSALAHHQTVLTVRAQKASSLLFNRCTSNSATIQTGRVSEGTEEQHHVGTGNEEGPEEVSELRQAETVLRVGATELHKARARVIYWRRGGPSPVLNHLPCHPAVAGKA